MAQFRFTKNERRGDLRDVTVEFVRDGVTIEGRSFSVTSHDQHTLDLVVNTMGAVIDKDAEVKDVLDGWDEMSNRVTAAEVAASVELRRQQLADELDSVLNGHIANGTILETKPVP